MINGTDLIDEEKDFLKVKRIFSSGPRSLNQLSYVHLNDLPKIKERIVEMKNGLKIFKRYKSIL